MITYEPFYQTLKKQHLHKYGFAKKYHLSKNLIARMDNNEPMFTATLDKLCELLNCLPEDIIKYKGNNDKAIPDTELQFVLDYAKNTDFSQWKEKTVLDKRNIYSTEMVNLRSLYQVYCLHHGIVFDDFITAECVKGTTESKAVPVLEGIYAETKKNDTVHFKHWLTFVMFMISKS